MEDLGETDTGGAEDTHLLFIRPLFGATRGRGGTDDRARDDQEDDPMSQSTAQVGCNLASPGL